METIGYGVYANEVINCLVGLPCTTCYQTTVTDYRATIYREREGETIYYLCEKSGFTTYSAAEKWAIDYLNKH